MAGKLGAWSREEKEIADGFGTWLSVGATDEAFEVHENREGDSVFVSRSRLRCCCSRQV